MELTENKLRAFIDEYIRPRVQADGGEIVFDAFDAAGAAGTANGSDLRLIAMGDCAVCPKAGHLRGWIKGEVKRRLGIDCNVSIKNKRRYFQDK